MEFSVITMLIVEMVPSVWKAITSYKTGGMEGGAACQCGNCCSWSGRSSTQECPSCRHVLHIYRNRKHMLWKED